MSGVLNRDLVTLDELDQLNHFERDVTDYAREVRNIGYDDAPEALLKLDAIVAACSEHRARIIRRAEEDADRIAEHPRDIVPPVDMTWRQ